MTFLLECSFLSILLTCRSISFLTPPSEGPNISPSSLRAQKVFSPFPDQSGIQPSAESPRPPTNPPFWHDSIILKSPGTRVGPAFTTSHGHFSTQDRSRVTFEGDSSCRSVVAGMHMCCSCFFFFFIRVGLRKHWPCTSLTLGACRSLYYDWRLQAHNCF